jgi:hypothetical protein
MTALRTAPILFLLLTAPTLACRESEARMLRPDFGVLADTLPGGCSRTACVFNASSEAAFVSWSGVVGGVASDTGGGGGGGTVQFGNADVTRGGTPQTPETFLSYNVVECSPSFCTSLAGGFGKIPNGHFSANGSTYRVSTNTTGNPEFFTFVGPTGNVTIEWVGNGLFENRFSGTQQFTTPDTREQQAGQFSSTSAVATGSVVGFTIAPGNSGQTTKSHDVRITISH